MTSFKPEDLAGIVGALIGCASSAEVMAPHVHAVWEQRAADAITSLSRELEEARAARDEMAGEVVTRDKLIGEAEASLTQARAEIERLQAALATLQEPKS